MHIDRLLVGRTAGAEQGVDESGQPVRFADDDAGIFAQIRFLELAFQ